MIYNLHQYFCNLKKISEKKKRKHKKYTIKNKRCRNVKCRDVKTQKACEQANIEPKIKQTTALCILFYSSVWISGLFKHKNNISKKYLNKKYN